jgi:hypothetical protein
MQEHMTPQPNFVRKILQMQDAGTLPRDRGVHRFDVAHDPWCQHVDDRPCNCDPTITVQWSQLAAAQH